LDGFLSLFDLAVLDVTEAEHAMHLVDGDLAAQDLAEGAELGVQVRVVPLQAFEALDEDGSRLDVLTTWLSADGMQVVRQGPTHHSLDDGEPVLLSGLACLLDGFEHHEGVVELLEEWSLDADLAGTNILLVEV